MTLLYGYNSTDLSSVLHIERIKQLFNKSACLKGKKKIPKDKVIIMHTINIMKPEVMNDNLPVTQLVTHKK